MTAPIGVSKSGNECSWCLGAQGKDAEPGKSHGICEAHLAEMKVRVAEMRKAARK